MTKVRACILLFVVFAIVMMTLLVKMGDPRHDDPAFYNLGDYGRGTPTSEDVAKCEAAHGEVIWYPTSDTWDCEATDYPPVP